MPTNIVWETIPSARLRIPISRALPRNDVEVENFILDEITKLIEQAENDTIILVDACTVRHDVREEVREEWVPRLLGTHGEICGS